MIPKPIYTPTGRAKEYGDLAINIYTGCNHGCSYCFAPGVLRKDRETFHSQVEPRRDIVESVRRQLDKEQITGKLIHLCFTCDPYPHTIDTTATREVIKAIKAAGNHVQILTKGGRRAERDFDLLDGGDWFGVTFTGAKHENEPNTEPPWDRIISAVAASDPIKTWVSCEPVLDPQSIYYLIESKMANYIDLFKIGKLNHHKPEDFGLPPIDWAKFGRECERLCEFYGRNYYIKDDLRKEMEEHHDQT